MMALPLTRRTVRRALLLILAVASTTPAAAAFRDITFPIRPDTAFLRQAVVSQVFTDEGATARVWDDGSGCSFLVLSDPRVAIRDGLIRLISFAEARVGQQLGSECLVLSEWSGDIETSQSVELDPGGNALRFRIVDSEIRDESARRGLPLGRLWDWVKEYVHPRLAAVRIDLQPALDDLRSVLGLVLQGEQSELRTALDSISLESVAVQEDELLVAMHMQVPEGEAQSDAPVESLTAAELARFEAAWQGWDSFVTFVVKHFAAGTATPEVRQELLNVLIEARYDLLEILTRDTGRARPDPVRVLFVDTWSRLAPVLRKLSPDMPGERGLNLLSFITAADALHTLDALGPGFDFDISLDGLRRMARILAPDTGQDPLQYRDQVDPDLRELFDFGPPLPLRGETIEPQGWWRGLVPDARAGIAVDDELVERLNGWVPPREELEPYLQSVHRLLSATGRGLAADSELDPALHDMYRILILATAWQETCWRQFQRAGDKIVPIRSSAGAVGLMQVVPQVWRGFYDPRGLTNDIAYNAAAGGEILMHYLVTYAIGGGEDKQPGGRDNLAWATYAAYNGGPGHLRRYREADTREDLRSIDLAFRDKYERIRNGDELAVRACYTG